MRHAHNYTVFGRLKPNVTLEQARADMDLVAARMAAADAKEFKWGAEVYPWRDIMVGGSRTELLALLGAVAMVLLIACVNIANLLLARSATRSHEFSIRTALGAGRSTILRQLLTESLLLSLCGGVAGLAAAKLGLGALTRLAASQFPRLWEGVHLDAMTLAFAAIVTLATAILFGLAPAWQQRRTGATMDALGSGDQRSGPVVNIVGQRRADDSKFRPVDVTTIRLRYGTVDHDDDWFARSTISQPGRAFPTSLAVAGKSANTTRRAIRRGGLRRAFDGHERKLIGQRGGSGATPSGRFRGGGL